MGISFVRNLLLVRHGGSEVAEMCNGEAAHQ